MHTSISNICSTLSSPLCHLILLMFAAGLLFADPVAALRTVRVGGTGAALGTMKIMGKAFQKSHPDITIEVLSSLGSGGGIKAASHGAISIAVAGRPPKEEEKSPPLTTRLYGRTPYLFVVNSKNNLIYNISIDDLVAIFSGTKTTWADNKDIFVAFRSERETDTLFIKSIHPAIAEAVTEAYKRPGLYVPVNDQENATYLEKSPGSFGVITLSQLLSEQRKLRPLKLAGIAPTTANLENKSYPFFKELFIVTRTDLSAPAQQFIDFIFSGEGESILLQTGHAPANE